MNLLSGHFGKSPARKSADEVLTRLAKRLPDVTPVVHDRGKDGLSIELPGFWLLKLDDVADGVQAQVLRPGLPGQNDAAFLMKIYHYESTATLLWGYSANKFDLYDLRVDGVYDVIKDFKDHYNHPFTAGTRLTFVTRHYLPYENGNTLDFREAKIYLQDGEEVYERFAEYFAIAPNSAQLVPARPSPFDTHSTGA